MVLVTNFLKYTLGSTNSLVKNIDKKSEKINKTKLNHNKLNACLYFFYDCPNKLGKCLYLPEMDTDTNNTIFKLVL